MIRKSPDLKILILIINYKVHLLRKLRLIEVPLVWYYNSFAKITTDENYILTKYKYRQLNPSH